MLKISETKLPKEVFGSEVNLNLLAQANYVYSNRNHVGLRKTKTRGEINRTTKKVYKQKGTGGARHGSKRANVFVGGGVVFGPRPVKRILSLSQGIKQAAKVAAFSAKNAAKEVLVLSGIADVKTAKEVSVFLKTQTANRFTFILSDKTFASAKFLRNLKNVKVVGYPQASAFDILNGGMILMDEAIFAPVAREVKKEKPVATKKTVKKGAKVK